MNQHLDPDPAHDDWQREIALLEDEARAAFLAQDIAVLQRLMSEDMLVNSPVNRVLDRKQVLDLLANGVIRHAMYEERIEAMKRYGDVVVVMGHDLATDKPGMLPVRRRFTNVWRHDGDAWRMVARHAQPAGGS